MFRSTALLMCCFLASNLADQQCSIVCPHPHESNSVAPPAGHLLRGKAGPKGERGERGRCGCEGMEEMCDEIARLKTNVQKLQRKPRDCNDIKNADARAPSGVYRIYPPYSEASTRLHNFDGHLVYCDMETDGGGWIIFQKRYDFSEDFNRTFEEYAEGFGSFHGEFWLGLNLLHHLTASGRWSIRMEMGSFDGENAWAEYSDFVIGGGTDFELTFDVDSYRGTAGDSHNHRSFSWHHGMKFSAYNFDQDKWGDYHCGARYGAWWHNRCAYVNFNGMPAGSHTISWYEWKGWDRLQSSQLKIRRI